MPVIEGLDPPLKIQKDLRILCYHDILTFYSQSYPHAEREGRSTDVSQ